MSWTTTLLIILLIIITILYALYDLFTAVVNKKVNAIVDIENKKLAERHLLLQQQTIMLAQRQQQLTQLEKTQLAEIKKQKDKIDHYYHEAIKLNKEAQQIRIDSAEKINLLEKRINQLQHELYCARQRAKKLVKRANSVL